MSNIPLPRLGKRFRLAKTYLDNQRPDVRRKFQDRLGTIVRETRDRKQYVLRFDGNAEATTYTLPKHFVDVLDQGA